MGTKGVGVYGINSVFSSGNLIFYEKAVGRTATGDVLTIGTTAVTVGGTAQAVDFNFYATGSISAILAAAGTLTLVGIATSTNGAVTITNATASTTTATGALIVTGGVGIAKGLFVGEVVSVGTVCQPDTSDGAALGTSSLMWSDLYLASGGVIYFNNTDVTITHASNALAIAGGKVTFDTAPEPSATDGAALGSGTVMWSDLFLASGGVINFNNGDATITHSTGVLAITPKLTVTGTGDYTSPAFSVTRTFVTADFDQTYHAAARINLDLTNDVPAAKYASALNVRIIGASDVASTGQLYGLWVDSAGTAAAIGGTFYMARYSVQAGAAIPTAYMQFQTADPGVTYAFAFVNSDGVGPCTAGGTGSTYTIAVQTPDGNPGYIRVFAAA